MSDPRSLTTSTAHLGLNEDAGKQPSTLNDTVPEDLDSDDHVSRLLAEADAMKREGNEHFRSQSWDEALVAYRRGLGMLPKRTQSPSPPAESAQTSEDKGKQRATSGSSEGSDPTNNHHPDLSNVTKDAPGLTRLETECAKARAVLNSNIGACYVKLGNHKEAADACTEALHDDPSYVKALQRRAMSNEKIGSWSSLAGAQEDYKRLLELLAPNSAQATETKRTLESMKPRLEAAQKHETDEMMQKLKGLGNQVLGNFGLSTDNFKFTPNGQGGYSLNFSR